MVPDEYLQTNQVSTLQGYPANIKVDVERKDLKLVFAFKINSGMVLDCKWMSEMKISADLVDECAYISNFVVGLTIEKAISIDLLNKKSTDIKYIWTSLQKELTSSIRSPEGDLIKPVND